MDPIANAAPDNRGTHPIDIVPETMHASPSEMTHPVFDDSTPFWKPSAGDIMKHLGWRWVAFLPAVLVAAALLSIPWTPQIVGPLFIGGGKVFVIAVGFAVATAGTAIKSAIKARSGPFCIHCGYDLTGLDEGHLCPECGRPFSLRLINEYRRDPAWFVQRYRNRSTAPIADVPFMAGPVRSRKSRDGT